MEITLAVELNGYAEGARADALLDDEKSRLLELELADDEVVAAVVDRLMANLLKDCTSDI